MTQAVSDLFKERRVTQRIVILMIVTVIGVAGVGYSDYLQGNEEYLQDASTLLAAIEGGILMGYIAVKNALTETPKSKIKSPPVV